MKIKIMKRPKRKDFQLWTKGVITFHDAQDTYIDYLEIKTTEVGELLRVEYLRGLKDGSQQAIDLISNQFTELKP